MLIGIDGNEANVPTRVGVGQYAYNLLQAFYNLKTKHKFRIYLKDSPLSSLPKARKDWQYRVFGPKPFWTRLALPLRLLTEKRKPDVFFTPSHYGPLFSPVPYVVSLMDIAYVYFPEYFAIKDLLQLSFWTRQSLKGAAHILTISKHSCNDIKREYKIPKERITVTYPGFEEDRFFPRSKSEINEVIGKYGISESYILFIGTLQPRKNLVGLIDAFSKMENKEVSLVIAGKKGWLYEKILNHAKTVGVEERVKFLGFVPEEELPSLLSGAAVFVLPSLYEGFGIPVIEAMACEVPVVCSNISSLPEVAGKAAILIDPTNINQITQAITTALTDEEERKHLIFEGKKQAKRFNWLICAKETLKVLEEVAHVSFS